MDLKHVQNTCFSKVIFAFNNLEQKILHSDLNFLPTDGLDWMSLIFGKTLQRL